MEETKKTSEPLISKNEIIKMIVILLFVCMHSMNITTIFSFISYEGLVFYNVRVICFSIFLSVLLTGLVIPFTKKLSKANLAINIFLILYMTLSQIKRVYTSDPIILSDVQFLGKIPQLARLAFGNASFESMKKPIIMLVIMILYTIVSYLFLKRNDISISNKKARIITFCVCLIIIIIMMNPTRALRDFIFKYAYSTDKYVDNDSYVSIGTYFLGYGVFPGLYGMHISNIFYEPKDYNEQELNALVSQVEKVDEKTYGKPNIIMYFSESFFDLEKTNEVKYNVPLCENFNKLKSENKAISVITPTYGGMSENVVFEVVSGGSNNFFPIGYIPVMSLYNYDSAYNMPSIAKDLKDNGYETKIMLAEDDYVSEDSFRRMGFDDYIEFREYGFKHDEMTDKLMLDCIKTTLENKEKPAFYLVESFEGHMPYNKDKYDTYDIDVIESKIEDQGDIEAIRAYSQAIHNADKALKDLYDYLQEFDEPTIVIFVGDHLPYLYNAKAENVLNKFDYFNTDDELENTIRKYNTEALVFANYEIDYDKIPNEISTNLLLDSVVINTENKLESYFEWLYDSRKVLPAMNRYLYIDSKGSKDFMSNISGKEKEIYDLREKMQYMFFINSR